MSNEIDRELQTMKSEKRMDELALKGHQWSISEKLNGSMGQDMMDVLEGKKKVEFSFWRKIKNEIDKMLWHLS